MLCRLRFIAFASILFVSCAPSAVWAQSDGKRQNATWRFEIANDFMFDSDNQFSNGFSVQKHSTMSADIDELQGVRAFGKGLARRILPQRDGLVYRKSLRIGQNMATPDDLEDPNIILDDVAYHGLLAAESSWIAFNDTHFTGFGITLGLVGEYSGAEALQKAVHSVVDATDPQGWDHQLDHEPVVNVYFMKKKKIWNTPTFDTALNFDVAVGNYHTGVNAGAEMRIGRKPDGFTVIADPLGRNMAYDATLGRQDGRTETYFTLAARAWAWAVFMPLEGNIFRSDNEWTDNNTIDPENVVGQAIAGFHFVWQSFGIHATWTFQSENINEDTLPPGVTVDNDFSFLMFEWRFD
jgi:hypothetical protein